MQKNNKVKEEPPPALVDHPEIPSFLEGEALCVHRGGVTDTTHSRDTHEALHAVALSHVPLEVWVAHVEGEVWVGVHGETGRTCGCAV